MRSPQVTKTTKEVLKFSGAINITTAKMYANVVQKTFGESISSWFLLKYLDMYITSESLAKSDGWNVMPNKGIGITRVALLISEPMNSVKINSPIDMSSKICEIRE